MMIELADYAAGYRMKPLHRVRQAPPLEAIPERLQRHRIRLIASWASEREDVRRQEGFDPRVGTELVGYLVGPKDSPEQGFRKAGGTGLEPRSLRPARRTEAHTDAIRRKRSLSRKLIRLENR